MNREACANCLVHGWKQLEDETALLQCKNCKVIQYCGQECQLEHWIKVHRHHCEYFADPTKNEPWQHKEQDCVICQQAAAVGESKLTQADNPNYECIHNKLQELPPDLHHPHPFPITGDPGDICEKAVIILWQLVNKFKLIQPNVARICEEEFLDVEKAIMAKRLHIWFNRKIYPKPRARVPLFNLNYTLLSIEIKMENSTVVDSFQLWQIITLVAQIDHEVNLISMSQFLKDPLTNLPDDTKNLVSDGMNNTAKYLTVANDVLEALVTKIIPYQEVLTIICGGSLEQKCSFCSKEFVISTEYFSNGHSYASNVFFSRILLGKYSCGCCGGEDVPTQSLQMVINHLDFKSAVCDMRIERKANMCDFCFQLTPIKQVGSAMRDIHRCSYCRTTMYCSDDCLHQDWKIHLKVCKKDKEGRKKKPSGSARRELARKAIEMEKALEGEMEKAPEDETEKALEGEMEKAPEDEMEKALEGEMEKASEDEMEKRLEQEMKKALEDEMEKGSEQEMEKELEDETEKASEQEIKKVSEKV